MGNKSQIYFRIRILGSEKMIQSYQNLHFIVKMFFIRLRRMFEEQITITK